VRIIVASCSVEEADGLARSLVEGGHVACVNLVPGVRAHYVWKGELCRDEEVLMWMETSDEACASAVARLTELHSYDVPKILVLEPQGVNAPYLAWLHEQVRAAATS